MTSTLAHERLAGPLGAQIHGVSLADLDDPTFAALRDLLHAHQVLFFRDQHLAPADQRAFAARFGPLQAHPAYPLADGLPEVSILHHDHTKPSLIDTWHTDMTFRPEPPLGSVLQGLVIPEVGGDTCWASMGAAYEALSDRMQRFIDGLTAVHSFQHGFKESLAEPGGWARLGDAVRANPPVVHPVVRVHPVTGRKGLFVNRLFTTHIVELSAAESAAVLEVLWQHAVLPDFTVRWRWTPGAIAVWDNRATQHLPLRDHGPRTRTMQRVVIAGDRPRGPA